MKKRIKYILIAVITLIIILIIIFASKKFYNIPKTPIVEDKNIIKIAEQKNKLPIDNDFRDNKKLFGSWNSAFTEIYVNGKRDTTIAYTTKFNIQIYENDTLDICYIDKELKCMTTRYAYVDYILYLEYDNAYLVNKSEVYFQGKYLVIKTFVSDDLSKYNMLYFEKSKLLS